VTYTEPGKRLTLFLGERDTYKHHSLAVEIVQRAKAAGLAGATMFRGIEGFGASRRIRTARFLTADLPLTVVIVDTAEAIDSFVAQLDDLMGDGRATVEDVDILRRDPRWSM
jgi:PII-like signaling protein